MLTVGDKFPEYDLTACVSLETGQEFEQINHKTYEGKWKVVFAWQRTSAAPFFFLALLSWPPHDTTGFRPASIQPPSLPAA